MTSLASAVEAASSRPPPRRPASDPAAPDAVDRVLALPRYGVFGAIDLVAFRRAAEQPPRWRTSSDPAAADWDGWLVARADFEPQSPTVTS